MAPALFQVVLGVLLAGPLCFPQPQPMVAGRNIYPVGLRIADRDLQLIGAGVRQKWFLDVYSLGAYSESGTCDPGRIIETNEIKYLRIDMIRDVGSGRMARALQSAFEKNTSVERSEELNEQIETFLSFFVDDLRSGSRLELLYEPGRGTSTSINGRMTGRVLPGKPFADLLWGCYFGSRTCCAGLKSQILSRCRKQQAGNGEGNRH